MENTSLSVVTHSAQPELVLSLQAEMWCISGVRVCTSRQNVCFTMFRVIYMVVLGNNTINSASWCIKRHFLVVGSTDLDLKGSSLGLRRSGLDHTSAK